MEIPGSGNAFRKTLMIDRDDIAVVICYKALGTAMPYANFYKFYTPK
jgi:hypothetical protein